MITSRDVSAGRRKRSFCFDEDARTRLLALQAGEERRGRARAALAVEFVVDERDGEVRFLADGLLAGGDRIQARRQRAQCLHERLCIPLAGVTLQHVDDLQVLQRAAQVGLVAGLQHVGEPRVLRALGLLRAGTGASGA